MPDFFAATMNQIYVLSAVSAGFLLLVFLARKIRRPRLATTFLSVAVLALGLVWLQSLRMLGAFAAELPGIVDPRPFWVQAWHLAPAIAGLFGLAAIWAGLGRPHWFLRMTPVGGLLALLALIPAYEPALMFLTQSAVTILPLLLIRRFSGVGPTGDNDRPVGQSEPLLSTQFTLLDLLLVTVLVALVSGLLVSPPSGTWTAVPYGSLYALLGSPPPPLPWLLFGGAGVAFGFATLLAAWAILGRGPRWLRAVAAIMAAPVLVTLLWLFLWHWAAPRDGLARSRAIRWSARAALVLLSVATLVSLGFLYVPMVFPTPIPKTVLPDPKGYDELVRLGKMLKNVTVPTTNDVPPSPPSAFAAFEKSHHQVLKQIHAALDRPCRVPVNYSHFPVDDLDYCNDFRQLGRALDAEGRQRIAEGRWEDAICCYKDAIRLGRAAAQGGLLIHLLLGITNEVIGINGIHDICNSLNPAQCRLAIEGLAFQDSSREALDVVYGRDRIWSAHALGWRGRLDLVLGGISGDDSTLKAIEHACLQIQALNRVAMTALAIRAYSLEHGQLPATLADLTPGYLPAVPEDPFSGLRLVYRRLDDSYALYSVGLDSSKANEAWAAQPLPPPPPK